MHWQGVDEVQGVFEESILWYPVPEKVSRSRSGLFSVLILRIIRIAIGKNIGWCVVYGFS